MDVVIAALWSVGFVSLAQLVHSTSVAALRRAVCCGLAENPSVRTTLDRWITSFSSENAVPILAQRKPRQVGILPYFYLAMILLKQQPGKSLAYGRKIKIQESWR